MEALKSAFRSIFSPPISDIPTAVRLMGFEQAWKDTVEVAYFTGVGDGFIAGVVVVVVVHLIRKRLER